jgi:hypothetical protein
MSNSDPNRQSRFDSSEEPEKWYCPSCEEFRYLDGDEGYCCDYPRDCPSDSFGEQNCGYVVCSDCHTPLSDRHLVTMGDML